MYINIIIPSRGGSLGLWATITQCEEELKYSQCIEGAKYVVVTNGESKLPPGTLATLKSLDVDKKLIHVHRNESVSPPVARQLGVDASDSENLFFFDNHCLPARTYFDRAALFFNESENNKMLHSTTRYYHSDFLNYHYKIRTQLRYNFWGESFIGHPPNWKPYKMAMAGHGGFACKKSLWQELGGYGPPHLLKGYGGEEPLFDLRLWLRGFTNHIHPSMIHYHASDERGYSRHYTKDYYVNMLSAAYVVGGETWLYRILDSLINKKHIKSYNVPKPSLLAEEAFLRCNEFYKEESKKYIMTLDELLEWFVPNGVKY